MANIYLGWLAYNNDDNAKKSNAFGPTLTLFIDDESEFSKYKFKKVYLLKQNDSKSNRIYNYLKKTSPAHH